MNALPSMMVLDFCEWLKNHASQQQGENYTDMFDLLLNDEYKVELIELAKEYLQGGGYSMSKKLIRRSYDEVDNGFIYDGEVTPIVLASSVKDYFDYRYDWELTPMALVGSIKDRLDLLKIIASQGMIPPIVTDLSLEIDFLEWLTQNKGKPMNLKRMPTQFFEILADEYCNYTNRNSDDKQKLVKAFKQSDTVSLGKKLIAVLSRTQGEKMKGLGYIYDRYVSEKIPFRCFLLPLASEGEAFENFIKMHWLDLHSMTGDHLDIYYSKEDYGKSGYSIKGDMQMAPKDLPGTLPCIVIWQENLKLAQAIDIEGLSDKEIVRLIANIVDLIKLGKTLDTISLEARKMTEEIRKAHVEANRPISNTTFHVENNTGVIAGYIQDSKVTVYGGSLTNTEFETETEKAIDIINSFSSVEQKYRDILITLVKEANVATQSRDEAAKSKCKSKFEGFVLGTGEVVGAIITKLSELATIAGFFGLTASGFLP